MLLCFPSSSCIYLQRGGEEVALRHDVHEEVGGNFSELVVEHADQPQVEFFVLLHGRLRSTQQSQQTLPVLEALVHVPKQEAHKGKLELP